MKKSYLGYKRYSPDKEEKALIIPSNVIDMTDVIHEEIYAIPYKKGRPQKAVLMKRGGKYTFDADYVVEIPRQHMQAAGMVDYDPYLADFISSPFDNEMTGLNYGMSTDLSRQNPTYIDTGAVQADSPFDNEMLGVNSGVGANVAEQVDNSVPLTEQNNITQTTTTTQENENPLSTTNVEVDPNMGLTQLKEIEGLRQWVNDRLNSSTQDGLKPPTQDSQNVPTHNVQNPNTTSTFNPYAVPDTGVAAYMLGQSLAGGYGSGFRNTATGIASGLKVGASLARNIASGIGSAKRAREAKEAYDKKQRELMTGIYQDGGLTPTDMENIRQAAGVDFDDQYILENFIKSPNELSNQTAPIDFGKYKNYFQTDGRHKDTIYISNTPANPHNAETIKELVREIKILNPNQALSFNYVPKSFMQDGGALDPKEAYMQNLEHYNKMLKAIGENDVSTLANSRFDGKSYSNNDLSGDYKKLIDARKELQAQGIDVPAPSPIKHAWNQVKGVVNEVFSFQDGGLTTPERLTGEYLQGVPENQQDRAMVEVEDGEHILQPDGTASEVVGDKHSNGGEKLTPEQVQVNSIVISDHLQIGAENAKYFREKYDIKATAKDTYATIVDRIKAKIGITKIVNEQEELFKKVEKQSKKTEDENTKRLNLDFLSGKINDLEQKKKELEPLRQDMMIDVYNRQEASKPQDEAQPVVDVDQAQIEEIAQANGIDPQQAMQIVEQYLKGGKLKKYQNGGAIEEAIWEFQNLLYNMQGKDENTIQEAYIAFADKYPEYVNEFFTIDTETKGSDILIPKETYIPRESVGSPLTFNPNDYMVGISQPGVVGMSNIEYLQDKTSNMGVAPHGEQGTRRGEGTNEKEDRAALDFSDITFLPDQSILPPSSIIPPLKVQTRLGRADSVNVSAEPMLVESQRQANAVMSMLNDLPPAQRAAALATIQGQTANASNQAIAQINAQNAQIDAETDRYNIQKSDTEQIANAQNALSYEDRMFKTLAAYEENLMNYYDYMRDLNTTRYNDVRNQNLVNSLFENYKIGADGSVQLSPQEIMLILNNGA